MFLGHHRSIRNGLDVFQLLKKCRLDLGEYDCSH